MLRFPTSDLSTSVNASRALGYRPWLDGLRGIAICTVFVHHLQHFIYQGGPLFGWLFLPFGLLGVDIFFVLSGFLITTLLLEEQHNVGKISLRNFYIRRALRLLPALVLFLACMVGFSRLIQPAPEADSTGRVAVLALFYSTNWFFALGGESDLLGHMWSLAVEEQFYVVWPVALSLLLRSRLSKPRLSLLMLATIGLVCIYRALLVSPDVLPMRIYAGSDTRADSLLVGCLVAMLASWRLLPGWRCNAAALKWAGVLSVSIMAAYMFDLFGVANRTIYKAGFTVFAIAAGLFILRLITAPNSRLISLLERPALVWIGKLSYSLYLWHVFAIGMTLQLPVSNAVRVALSVPIALAIVACSYYLIEKPFLKLKSRYASAPTSATASTASTPFNQSPNQTTASFV